MPESYRVEGVPPIRTSEVSKLFYEQNEIRSNLIWDADKANRRLLVTDETRFTTTLEERGFTNGQPLTRLVANGCFVDNGEITPSFGIGRDALLKDRAKRRKHGLPADLRPPTLEDESGRARTDFRPDSGWVTADITVATDADPTPIAPGTTVSDTVTGDRRTVRFPGTDVPINHFFSIQSARYEVRREKVGDIDLAVYHHPGHDHNVERMLQAMKASLALFGAQSSPYKFKQARILEFPSYADFAQSFANTIPYSENLGFLMRPPEGASGTPAAPPRSRPSAVPACRHW